MIERFGEYMHKHRKQADGKLRDSDNWQKGITLSAYIKSGYRHFIDWWKWHRGYTGRDTLEDSLCPIIFNASGYLHELLKKNDKDKKIYYHEKNMGKGAAIRTALKHATGTIIAIQDADLEYSPDDYSVLLKPFENDHVNVVYGSRFIGGESHRILYFWHYFGNQILTTFSNILTNLNLTDMETGYKAFTKEALQKILPKLTANRFGIEPEITAQIAKNKLRIYEIGVSYSGRTYKEGKKINWKDGLAAIWHIIKFNLFR